MFFFLISFSLSLLQYFCIKKNNKETRFHFFKKIIIVFFIEKKGENEQNWYNNINRSVFSIGKKRDKL